jgi:hypothetical protein
MRTPSLVLYAALALGCKGKPTTEDPPPKLGSAATAPSVNPSSADIKLPDRTTTPPTKRGKVITEPEMAALQEITFPGFHSVDKVLNDKLMVVVHKTTTRPILGATVTIRPCSSPADCIPMDLDKWKASTHLDELLPADIKSQPDTHFESGMTDINGEPMVYAYQYGQNFKTDETGTHGMWSNAYVLNYNDGVNWIRVIAELKDFPPKTIDGMVKQTPKADLEKIAKSMMDFYTHKW